MNQNDRVIAGTSAPVRLALLTCSAMPELFREEQALPTALAAEGIEARAIPWSDFGRERASFDVALFRSTWDYFERVPEFAAFLDEEARHGTRMLNPLSTVRWNMDKAYLLELETQGVRIVPTFYARDRSVDLARVLAERGWERAVLKPAISGGAFRTHLFDRSNASALDVEATELARTGALVQPFLPEIARDGELSLLYFGGAFSHAVRKLPQAGDYRVQLHLGGTYTHFDPTPALFAEAERVLRALPERVSYARIDGVMVNDQFHLMEVELIEPYLYFATAPEAMARFAKAIAAELRASV